MGGKTVTDSDRKDIRLLWSQNVRLSRIKKLTGFSESTIMKLGRGVERPPCECGRVAGHKGHCRERNAGILDAMKEARAFWEGVPDDIVLRRYKLGDDLDDIASEIESVTGRRVTNVAVQVRANKLNTTRPDDFRSDLRKRGVTGHRKGTKNRRPYVMKRVRSRNTKRKFVSELSLVAEECDAVFEYLMVLDRQDMDLCVHSETKLKYKDNTVHFKWLKEQARKRQRKSQNIIPDNFERAVIVQLYVPRPVVENTIPTARADPATKGKPYSMSSMSGPDPDRERRLRQMAEASKGRV